MKITIPDSYDQVSLRAGERNGMLEVTMVFRADGGDFGICLGTSLGPDDAEAFRRDVERVVRDLASRKMAEMLVDAKS